MVWMEKSPNLCACCTSKKVIFNLLQTKSLNKAFVAFLGTKSGDPSRVVPLEGSIREVEECGLQGMTQGVTGSLNCYCPVQNPIQEALEF
jgi:hypothetical protein